MLNIFLPTGIHSRYRARCDRCDSTDRAGATHALENGHHHPRPSRVRALRKGTNDGQMGYGKKYSFIYSNS